MSKDMYINNSNTIKENSKIISKDLIHHNSFVNNSNLNIKDQFKEKDYSSNPKVESLLD